MAGSTAIWGQDMQRICKPHETDVATLLKSSQFAGDGDGNEGNVQQKQLENEDGARRRRRR